MRFHLAVLTSLFCPGSSSHVVVSLGSSYAAGIGLKQSYGSILADLLSNSDGTATQYIQGAVSGSILTDVPTQATKIQKNTTVITLTSGGNDVDYVGCLFDASKSSCSGPAIDVNTWTDRFNKALDSIISNLQTAGVANPARVPIYVVTYPQALGADTKCGPINLDCTLTPTQFTQIQNIYNDFTNWTINAYNTYKSSHPYNIHLLDMRPLSANHDVGSQVPWINGKRNEAPTNGAPWHPNKSGVTFIASAIYADLDGKPSPTPKYR